jgi:hypothetical protein
MLTAAVVVLYALRGDGSFDLVTRQENGLVIWWILAVGIALGLVPVRRPGAAAALTAGLLTLLTVWAACSLAWTESAERTTAEVARDLDYLGLLVLAATMLQRRTWRAAVLGLVAGAVAVCVLALASRLSPGSLPATGAGRVFGRARLSYPFGYWNAVGAWASITAAVTFAWGAGDRRRGPRMVASAAVPVAVTTAYLTYSRGATAGLAVGAALVIACSRGRWTAALHLLVAATGSAIAILAIRGAPEIANGTGAAGSGRVLAGLAGAAALSGLTAWLTERAGSDRWRLPRRGTVTLVTLVAAAAIVAAAIFGPSVASHAYNDFRHPKVAQSSNPAARLSSLSGYRYQLWKVALRAFTSHPLTGTGAGTFQFWWSRHATETQFVRNAHSLWLETMGELGLPGVLLVVAFALAAMATAIGGLRRSRRSASAAACAAVLAGLGAFLTQASVDWMWQSSAVTVLGLGGVGVVAARSAGPRLRLRPAARAGLALLAALAGLVQLPGLLSTSEVSASQAAVRSGRLSAALRWADHAVGAEPWAAAPYLQRGLVLEALGRLHPAAGDVRSAIGHQPTDSALWASLARIETELGDTAAATADYRRALTLSPYSAGLR